MDNEALMARALSVVPQNFRDNPVTTDFHTALVIAISAIECTTVAVLSRLWARRSRLSGRKPTIESPVLHSQGVNDRQQAYEGD